MSHKIIYYYQTFNGLDDILSNPVNTDIIIVSAIHFGKNPEYIHLNDHPPNDPKFNVMWDQVKECYNKNIKMCPKNISSHNLTFICDNVVTLRGTIGLEFACQGKYSITAGIATYSNLGFSFQPKNKYQYFSYLKNITHVSKLNSQQILKAKKVLYFFENKKQHNRLENSKVFSEFISHNEKSFFCKKLIDNFENITSFEKDPYYKNIANKFVI